MRNKSLSGKKCMKNAVLLMLSAALAVCPAIGAAAEAVEGEGMEAPGMENMDWIEEDVVQADDSWEEDINASGQGTQDDQIVPEGEPGVDDALAGGDDLDEEDWSWDEVGDGLQIGRAHV